MFLDIFGKKTKNDYIDRNNEYEFINVNDGFKEMKIDAIDFVK